MEHEGAPGLEAAWETLVRVGVAKELTDEVTVTPGHYRAGGDEVTMPAPLSADEALTLEHLPVIRMDPADPHADLELGRRLGKGGMGSVHVARQTSLKRDVAVKRLSRPDEPTHVHALLREAVITGALEHPNIVPVHALGQDEQGHPVLVMKRIQGSRWSDLQGVATLERHLDILEDVCNALHYAHEHGVLHLDLKPQNVLIGSFGEVALLDWGIARRLDDPPPDLMLGTPAWMAPEMVDMEPLGPRTDVYLLGGALHWVLTGTKRHTGRTTHMVLLAAHASEPVDYPQEIPPELAELCNRATHRDPAQRLPSALAFREAIRAWRRHRTSAELARVGIVRLERFKAQLAATQPDKRVLREIAGNARFGLREALDQWPENRVAREALMDLLEHRIRWELEAGVPEEAEALLVELGELGEAGEARRRALQEEVADAARRARALHKLGREMDLSRGSGWRVALVMLIGIVGTAAGTLLLVAVRLGFVVLDHPLNIALALAGALAFSLVLFLARRQVMNTVVNQRVWFMVFVAAWAFVGNRALGPILGLTVEQVIAQELQLAAVAAGLFGVAVDLRLLVGCAVLVLASLGAAFFPAIALEIAIATIASCGLVGVAALWHWIR